MKKFILVLFMFLFAINVNASDLNLSAKSSILVEYSTGKVLYESNSSDKRSPASMTKMMTLLLTFEALEYGKIKLTDEVLISKNASSMGGTQIYAQEGTYVTLENLIKGVSIASANDAAVAISEYIGGTEENFVKLMNEKATELGCKNTSFKNPHGLDEEGHYSTAYDLSLIARELIKHEEVLKYTSTYEDYITVSGTEHWLVNTNKLVKFYKGIDGLKTGYTDKALYCLTATMNKNNMRLISVVMGEENKDNRNTDTINILEYGYSMYGIKTIIDSNEYVKRLYVSNSSKRYVNYYIEKDINIVLDKNRDNVEYEISEKLYDIKAPIKKGSTVGKIYIKLDNEKYEYNLIVKENIKKSNYFECIWNIFKDIINGKINILLQTYYK